jgi:MmyB-like transcription regulator ligand binding domain
MIRWMFRLPATALPWTDDEAVRFTRSTVADLRASYARYPADPGIQGLVTELLVVSPQFAQMWAEHEVESRRPIIKRSIIRWPARWSSSAGSCISRKPASG